MTPPKKYIPHWVLHYGSPTKLRKEYQNSLRTNQTTAQEGEERVFDLTKIEKSSQEIFSDLRSLLEQNSISNERITNLQTHDFSTIIRESRGSYLEKEQEFSERVEKTHKLLENLKNMPGPTFLNSFWPSWQFKNYIKNLEESFAELEFSSSVMARVLLDSRVELNDVFNRVVRESLNYGRPVEVILQRLQTSYSREKNELDRLIEVGKKTLELKDEELENKEQEKSELERIGREQLQKSEEELTQKQLKLSAVEKERNEAKGQVVIYKEKVKVLEEGNINHEIKIKNLSEKSTILTETLSNTRQDLRSVESTKNSLKMQVFNLKNEKEQLVNRIQILEEQRRTITRNYQQIARKCQAYEEIEAAIQERLARNATIADPKDAKLSGQEETIELQKVLIAKKVIDIKDLKETIRILSHSYQEFLEHKEDLDEEIKDFTERLEKKETKLQELTTDYRSLKKAKEEVNERLVTQEENYSKLENNFNKTQKELSDWKNKFSALEEERDEIEEKLIQEKKQLEVTKQSLENLQMLVDAPPVPQSELKWQQKLSSRIAKLTGKTKKPASSSSSPISDSALEERLKNLRGEENSQIQNPESKKQEFQIVERLPVSNPTVNKKLFWFVFVLVSLALISGLWKIGEISEAIFRKLVSLIKRKLKSKTVN